MPLLPNPWGHMEGRPPHYPRKLFAFLVLGALGLALIAVGVTGHTGGRS